MTESTTERQLELSARKIPCPSCATPMVGARIYDPDNQEAFVGLVRRRCDQSYRVKEPQ